MTESEKQSWEKVRSEGRDRFLLKSIADNRRILLAGLLVDLGWWLFTGEPDKPIWQTAAGWIFVVVAGGAWFGTLEWNTNERNYNESCQNSAVK